MRHPTPVALMSATVGLLMALVPAVPSDGWARGLASSAALFVLATLVTARPGAATVGAGIATIAAAVAALHGHPVVVPIDAVALLAYLLVADIANTASAIPQVTRGWFAAHAREVVGGLVVIGVVTAVAVLPLLNSLGLALGALIVALVVVLGLKALLFD